MDFLLLQKFALSLALGALIGIEREKSQQNKALDFAGIRTFIFFSLIGTLAAYLAESYSPVFLMVISGGMIVIVSVAYGVNSVLAKHYGMTTEASTIVAYLLGILCFVGPAQITIALAIFSTIILSLKYELHNFVKHLTRFEFYDGLKFMIIAFVVLPLLPNRYLTEYQVINPYEIWLMVVFVSGFNFFGYMLMKFLGSDKGIGITGFLGGLMSSTAVVTSLAAKSKTVKDAHPLVVASVLACATMFIRVLIEVYILNPALFQKLLFPMVAMAVIGYIPALFILKSSAKIEKVHIPSPLNLKSALMFGLFYSLILIISRIAHFYFGDKGIFISSLISGFADVDAITLYVARPGNNIPLEVGSLAVVVAAAVNTFSKIMIANIFGTKEYGRNLALMLGLLVFVGVGLAFII